MTYNLAWLNNQTALRCILAEVTANVSGTETTFYLSSKGYVSRSGDTPANTVYFPAIAGGVNVVEEITLDGTASMAYGDLELYNVAGERDGWLDYVWSNRSIKVYIGDLSWPRADFQLIFDGVIADIDSKSRDRVNLKIRDKLERLNSPVSDVKLGGTTPNADNVLPLIFGEVFNVTPLLTNPATLEYQVHSGRIAGIIEVRDNGVPITSYTPSLETGKFNLTAAPAGVITVSAQGYATTNIGAEYFNTVAELIQIIALNYGKASTRFLSADLDLSNLVAFEGANKQPVGVYINARENVINVIQQMAASVGAVAVMSRLGKLQLLKITFPPTGTPTAITNADIVQDSLRIISRVNVTSSVKLGYCKNWTTQTGLQTGIPEAHKDLLSNEFLTITRTNNLVSTLYKLDAEPIQRDTLLLATADASAEADRHMDIFKTPRTVFGFELFSQGLFLNLGDAVTLTHPRFNLSAGKTGTVIKLQPDWMTSRVYVEAIFETLPPIIDLIAPTAPGTLTATAISSTQIDLAWGAATDAAGVTEYNIYLGGVLINVIGNVLTYSAIDLTPATSYSFTVKAVDAAGNIGSVSNTATTSTLALADTTAPTAPSSLTATTTSSSTIALAWTAGTDAVGVTGNQIIRNGSVIDTIGAVTAYDATGLAAATLYNFQVKAFDAAGNLSAVSNTSTATTSSGSTTQTVSNTGAITIGPNAQAGVPYPSEITIADMVGTITNITAQLINFSHTYTSDVEIVLQSPDATKFVMLMGDVGAATATSGVTLTFSMAAGSSLPGTALSTGTYLPTNIAYGSADTSLPAPAPAMPYSIDLATFNGISPNGVWKLFVYDDGAADSGSIAGGWSITVTSAASGGADSTAPTAPSSLVATALGAASIGLTWTASTDAVGVTGYKIIRDGVQVSTSLTNSYTDSGLSPSTNYAYTVRGYDAANNTSGDSNTASATTSTVSGIYVSTAGNDTTGTGTLTLPYRTIQKGISVAYAGDTVYIRGGVYPITTHIVPIRSGTSNNRINIFGYPGERPIIDGMAQTTSVDGIRVSGFDWLHFKNLSIQNCYNGGLRVIGSSSDNIFENLDIGFTGRSGAVGVEATGVIVWNSAARNQFINIDSHHNRGTVAGDTDGFSFGSTGLGNTVTGCRSYYNSDDGYDSFDSQDNLSSAPVVFTNCYAWRNGYSVNDAAVPSGNGNGFKMGGRRTNTSGNSGGNTYKNCVAFQNLVSGYSENEANLPCYIYNCTGHNNTAYNFAFWGTPPANLSGTVAHVLKNNLAHTGANNATNVSATFNSWNLAVTVSNADFVSVDSITAKGARDVNGNLPNSTYLKLVSGSDLIDKGTPITGITYTGASPDLGAYEGVNATPTPVTYTGKVVIVGDSTAEYVSTTDRQGWGTPLITKLAARATVTNASVGGTSAKEWLAHTGGVNWTTTLATVNSGDYVFISLGHNDEGDSTSDEYKANITTMVIDVKAKSATPIIVTSLTRRYFSGGKIYDNHPFVPRLYEIAGEQNVKIIQLYELSKSYCQTLGDAGSTALYYTADNTHPNNSGAGIFADLIVAEINRLALYGLSTEYGTTSSDVTNPTAPTLTSATATSSSQVNLVWTQGTDAVGVTQNQILVDGAVTNTITAATSYSKTGLTAGTAYNFAVKALDAAANASPSSNTLSATTQSASGVLSITKTDGNASNGNLATLGVDDWYKYSIGNGNTANTRKSGGTIIATHTVLDGTTVQSWGAAQSFQWSSGTPTASGSNIFAALYYRVLNAGWQVKCVSTTTQKVASVYVSQLNGACRVEASLEDSSASPVSLDFSATTETGTRFDITFKSGVTSNLVIKVYALSQSGGTVGTSLHAICIN
jgi:lysophospholipase L1-like esterase/chitodextrinase